MRRQLLAVSLSAAALASIADAQAFSATEGCELRAADGGGGLSGRGPGYGASFTAGGVQVSLAPAAGEQQGPSLHLVPVSVRAGERVVAWLPSAAPPEQDGTAVRYRHAHGVTEQWELRRAGVELSWRFEQPLGGDGDLVVRYAATTALAAPVAKDGGLELVQPAAAGAPPRGIRIGKVTGVDARGERIAGTVRCAGGVVELVLPAAFVASAAYPLVLDPAIGAIVPYVTGLVAFLDHDDPDAAFDASSGRFLVGWHHASSQLVGGSWTHDVQAQRVNASTGALVGAVIPLATNGVPSGPRIANLGTRNRFGVVWTQLDGATSSVKFAAVDAATGAITHTFTVASSTTSTYSHADVGCETNAPIGAARGFVVVWEDDGLDAIRARRVWFSATDTLGFSSTFSVLADTPLGSSYTTPAISRAAGPDGKLLVVVRRDGVLFPGQSIFGAVVETGSSTVGPTGTIYSNSSYDATAPDVDGYAGRWVAAWQRDPAGGADPRVVAAPVSVDAGGALTAGSGHIYGSTSAPAQQPSVGYTPGKTWLAYRSVVSAGFPPSGTITQVVTGMDAGSCLACADVFTSVAPLTFVPIGPGTVDRVTVATMTSGGATSGENALALWSHDNDVNGQLLRNHSLAGGISNLGGGCGAGGTQSFSHSPAIGSSGLVCAVTGLSPTAIATIFNFGTIAQPIPCGPCQWRPFVVTLTPPIVAGGASVEFPIPCLVSLVGAVCEIQWTTVDLAQAPCPTFPGLSLSPRMALQIGQ